MTSEIQKILGLPEQLDEKSSTSLAAAIGKSVPKEFDYLKYRQSLYAMRDLKLEEATAFRSAYAAAQTMGVTKAGLVASAQQYLSVLMNEKTKFGTALNNQVKERVESKRAEVVKLHQRIEEMRQKIRDLEARIAEYQNTINTADDDVASAKQKILDTKDRFERAFQAFVDAISKDIERINQFL